MYRPNNTVKTNLIHVISDRAQDLSIDTQPGNNLPNITSHALVRIEFLSQNTTGPNSSLENSNIFPSIKTIKPSGSSWIRDNITPDFPISFLDSFSKNLG